MAQRILLVEDDRYTPQVLEILLQGHGYETRRCGSAEEAIAELPNARPALILCGQRLPGLSGADLCKRLRAQSPTAALPIIMLGASKGADGKVDGLDSGAD